MGSANGRPPAVCVYAGSSPGADPAFAEAAVALGRTIAGRGLELVYGGGAVGLMGAVADAAMAAGGRVTGIIPRALEEREIGHREVTDLVVVETMHERKAMMAHRSGCFIALPGGIGTLEELVEALTWTQLGIHRKPVGLLDVSGYWGPLMALLDHAVEQRFVRPEHRSDLLSGTDPGLLLDALAAWRPSHDDKWMDEVGRSALEPGIG
ncbi:MAG: TIGR00730 family Rossman fold protein [Thermoleophilia bacterium]